MRILFVSNLFPPYARGGYEQWCEEVAHLLAARGHQLAVLTSRRGVSQGTAARDGSPPEDGAGEQPLNVQRVLQAEVEGGLAETTWRLLRTAPQIEAENLAATRDLLASFQPDAVLIWGMWNINRSVPQQIERAAGSRVAYYFCDYWPSLPNAYVQRLQEPARHAPLQWFKSVLSRVFLPRLEARSAPPLRLEHPICVSHAVRDILVERGVPVAHAKVIHGGTQVEEFATSPAPAPPEAPLRLLYMGRLEPIKGVHTAVQAMQQLGSRAPVTLDILGGGAAEYVAELQGAVTQGSLQERVRFIGGVPRAQVPSVLAEHDVLLFPSEWEEPFARSVLEAMAAGLVVIGTTTGGTGEILREGETGLTFAAGDAERLAAQISRVVDDPALRERLREAGRRTVRRHYTLERMVDDLERELQSIAQPAPITC